MFDNLLLAFHRDDAEDRQAGDVGLALAPVQAAELFADGAVRIVAAGHCQNGAGRVVAEGSGEGDFVPRRRQRGAVIRRAMMRAQKLGERCDGLVMVSVAGLGDFDERGPAKRKNTQKAGTERLAPLAAK